MTEAPFLPYGRQSIDDDDAQAVLAVLRSDFLTTGPAVGAFEDALARRTGAAHAVACSSGTAALHLAALALNLGPGDGVVVPSVTFLATANAARYVGAEVIFADVDPQTGLMGPEHLEQALSRAGDVTIKAVFPVHLTGQPVAMPAVAELARKHDLAIVEDACHALGGEQAETPVGACAFSDMAAFSFHPVKTVVMGEGGAVTTNNAELAQKMRLARSHGIVRDAADFQCPSQAFAADLGANPWYYEMPEPGFNYRASDLQCALGLSQLRKLDAFVARRAALVAAYREALSTLAPVVRPIPLAHPKTARISWHLMVVHLDFAALGIDRAAVMHRLRDMGIGTQVHYLPVHRQPYYRQRYGLADLPGADAYYATCLSLPLFVDMQDGDVARVVDGLRRIVETP